MKDGKIGWGIAGPGNIANDFAECLQLLDDAYIAAAGSRSLERAQAYCDKWGGHAYGSYEELMRDPEVDLVYVAVTHPQHMGVVKLAAEAGKAILCEKPFSPNMDHTMQMIGAAREHGVFLMEGLWSRFFPAWQFAAGFMREKKLGEIRHIRSVTEWGCSRIIDKSVSKETKAGAPLSDDNRLLDPWMAGGSLLDGCPYSIAAMVVSSGLLEMPEALVSNMVFTHTGVDARTTALLTFKNGMTAELVSDLYGLEFRTVIECEKGILEIPRHRDPDRVIIHTLRPDGGYDREELYFPFEGKGFQFEAKEAQECFRKGLKECPQVTHAETILYTKLCDEIRRQNGLVFPFEK